MKVKTLFFSVLREQLKKSEAVVEICEGETVASLAQRLAGSPAFPLLFAVNQEYVARDYVLKEGDEVAFIPPVAGG